MSYSPFSHLLPRLDYATLTDGAFLILTVYTCPQQSQPRRTNSELMEESWTEHVGGWGGFVRRLCLWWRMLGLALLGFGSQVRVVWEVQVFSGFYLHPFT